MITPAPIGSAPPTRPPPLLDQLRHLAIARGHVSATADAYVDWSRRFILFHGKRPPRELGTTEIVQFLEHVARVEPAPLVAIAVGRTAMDFLFNELLQKNLGELPWVKPPRLLDQARQVLRVRHYSPRTEDC